MAEHLKKRQERNIKSVLVKLGKLAIGAGMLTGATVGGVGIYQEVSKKIPLPITKDISPPNCKASLTNDLVETPEPGLALLQQEAINNKINTDACEFAYAVGKQTINYYLLHPKLFKSTDDSGGELDLDLSNSRTGTYDEIDYATQANGDPIYSQIEGVMVGYSKHGLNWFVSIDPSAETVGSKSGTQWELMSSANKSNSYIPSNFDTTVLPGNVTADQLQSIESQEFKLGLYMLGTNH